MAQVQVRDQNGKGIGGIAINLGRRDEPGKRLFTQTVDPAGNTDFQYAAAGIVSLNALPADQKWILYVNDAEAFNPNWKNIEQKQVNVDSFAADVPITLQVTGNVPGPTPPGPITGDGTCEEWRKAVFAIFAKHGFATNGPENAGQGTNQAPYQRATIAEIKALHPSPYVQWQYSSVGTPPELRPRLFLPNPGGQFDRYADMGDWDKPLKWEHCQ